MEKKNVKGISYDPTTIQEKIEEMTSGKKKQENYRYIRQDEDVVRYLPWGDGDLVKEMFFHYNIGRRRFLVCPRTVGSKCRICDEGFHLLSLAKTQKEETEQYQLREQGKKLISRQYAVAPVIVRNRKTEKLVMLDNLFIPPTKNSTKENEYKKFLSWLSEPDYGNITDFETGRDIKLTSRDVGKGKYAYKMWTFEPKLVKSPLCVSEAEKEEILKAIPVFENVYKILTYEDTEQIYADMMAEVEFLPVDEELGEKSDETIRE